MSALTIHDVFRPCLLTPLSRTLAFFSRRSSSANIPEDVAARNRKYTLPLLKGITERGVLGMSETTIMAWGQLGRYVFVDLSPGV